MSEKIVIDIIGWAGSVCVLSAYGMLSMNKLTSASKLYQILNITGSIFLIVNTLFYNAYPSTFVNVVWLAIGIFALINIYKTHYGANSG
jgi:hypothetical protein